MNHGILRFRRAVGLVIAYMLLASAASSQPLGLEFVPVDNAGNQGNARHIATNGYGAVGYSYEIGKYEVTAGQYAQFLNEVAATDTYGLYNANMWSSLYGCKIQQSGSQGSYTYSVASDWANRPVNFVSWYDAARFANWLTTGDTESGAYQFDGGSLVGINRVRAVLQSEETIAYVLPTVDEWYKAAYHNNVGMSDTDYFNYPTGTDTEPSNQLTDPDPGNNATFLASNPLQTIGSPYYRTEVGAFENSESPYGTFDQGGNVYEWNETAFDFQRGMLGGSFENTSVHLRAHQHHQNSPTEEYEAIGFRVASYAVPEPTSAVMLVFAAIAGLLWRKR